MFFLPVVIKSQLKFKWTNLSFYLFYLHTQAIYIRSNRSTYICNLRFQNSFVFFIQIHLIIFPKINSNGWINIRVYYITGLNIQYTPQNSWFYRSCTYLIIVYNTWINHKDHISNERTIQAILIRITMVHLEEDDTCIVMVSILLRKKSCLHKIF